MLQSFTGTIANSAGGGRQGRSNKPGEKNSTKKSQLNASFLPHCE